MSHIVSIRNGMSSCDEKDLSNIAIAYLSGSGVVGASDYLVAAQASPNNTVQVATGRAYVYTSDFTMAYSTYHSTTDNVTIAANSSGNPRIDSIVLYIDLSASPDAGADNVAKFFDVQGTPAGSPVAPTGAQILTAIGASNPYIVLANIAVANGFVSINSANITDVRTFATIGTGDTVFHSTLSNFVQSGISIPTSASLTTTSTSGVIYYNGIKVSVASDGGHTYTASKDTYVDVSNTGAYSYNAVNNGASAPALSASSIRVAKVVSGASTISSVVQVGTDSNGVVIYPNSPLSLAKVPGGFVDQSGNALITITPTASAVNGINITNSATGNAPIIQPQGTDTNIDLKLTGLGTGKTRLTSTYGNITTDTDGSTITFDCSPAGGNRHRVVLGGNRTLALSNYSSGQIIVLDLIQDGTGSRTVTWFQGPGQTTTITIATPAVLTTGVDIPTGTPIILTTTGSLPTGLTAGTVYWYNRVSSTTGNLSTTLANVQAGTYINTSGSQSGTHTLNTQIRWFPSQTTPTLSTGKYVIDTFNIYVVNASVGIFQGYIAGQGG